MSPSTTPIRELSPDSEASSTQQESATVSPSISQHTQHEDNLSDVDADLDDLVSLDDDDDREQVFNMVDEAQRMAENPSSVPLGMTPEPEHVDHSRPALAQISHHSSRLQEDSDRPRPAFPNYLMDEYLEMHPISVEIPIDKRLQSATVRIFGQERSPTPLRRWHLRQIITMSMAPTLGSNSSLWATHFRWRHELHHFDQQLVYARSSTSNPPSSPNSRGHDFEVI